MIRDNTDNCFYIDARGGQETTGAEVEVIDGRATVTITGDLVPLNGNVEIDGHSIKLTRIQTEELTLWLMRQLMRES